MFSLIITIISVALVTALALATLYFGGETYRDAQLRATASAAINQGQQLLAASELFYLHKRTWPTGVAELQSEGYLNSTPSMPGAMAASGLITPALAAAQPWAEVAPGAPHFWVRQKASAQLCREINWQARGDNGIYTHALPLLETQCYGTAEPYTVLVHKADRAVASADDGVGASPSLEDTVGTVAPGETTGNVTPGDLAGKTAPADLGGEWAEAPTHMLCKLPALDGSFKVYGTLLRNVIPILNGFEFVPCGIEGATGPSGAVPDLAEGPTEESGDEDGSLFRAASITAGYYSTCAVTPAGAAKCWGWNYTEAPSDIVGLTSGVQSLAAGDGAVCALTSSGTPFCWGHNGSYGILGDGTTEFRSTPVGVVGLDSGVASIVPGYYHSCAVTTLGAAKCWGANYNGQLGSNAEEDTYATLENSLTPVDVTGLTSGVASISVGLEHTCALTVAGGVKCWGMGYAGTLGDGGDDDSFLPVDVVGLSSGASRVVAGYAHSCAIVSSGVKCWGPNWSGQLGDGTDVDRRTPVDVVGLSPGVTSIAIGDSFTCAVTAAGGVKCWGANWSGQLGDGTYEDRWTPVDVVGLTSGAVSVAVGTEHACALLATGHVKCWGNNDDGQLGDGTYEARLTPVDVLN